MKFMNKRGGVHLLLIIAILIIAVFVFVPASQAWFNLGGTSPRPFGGFNFEGFPSFNPSIYYTPSYP